MMSYGVSRKRSNRANNFDLQRVACQLTLYFVLRGIVERASENKIRDGFIDRKRKELGVGKGGNRRQFFSRARSVSGLTKLSICEQDIIELQIIVSQQPMSELK